jgi:hypothetical protein
MYPEDSVQSIIATPNEWWIENSERKICRGALIFAFIPHVDQVPYGFQPIGRNQADEHGEARMKVAPLKVDQPLKQTELPVAAMPLHKGEVWAAYRSKVRPCLVLGSVGVPAVDKKLLGGMPKYITAPTILVAPHYGANKNGSRAGYNPVFVERIRHCEYPQFVWNPLPTKGGPTESILRLDQLQPIGAHYHSHRVSEFKLSDDALEVMDELLQWLIWSGVLEGGNIASYRELIEATFDD